MRSPDEIGALLLFPVLRIVAEQAGLSQPAPFVVYLLRKCPKKANFTKIFASFHFFACFRNPKIFIAKLPEKGELRENFRILSLFRVFSQSQNIYCEIARKSRTSRKFSHPFAFSRVFAIPNMFSQSQTYFRCRNKSKSTVVSVFSLPPCYLLPLQGGGWGEAPFSLPTVQSYKQKKSGGSNFPSLRSLREFL